MKLVTKNTDTGYLHSLKELLEENGIPAVVNGENTARLVTPFVMTEPSLWVYLDYQHGEADNLVNDPNYQVVNKVDIDEFYKTFDEITKTPQKLNDALIHLGITMVGILLGMIILIKLLQ
jgi:hypothetical protein